MPHPSIAVKIDNHEDARPQVALNRTDLVFEELVEGGLTRYVAVWHSDVPDAVGPVRSIRPMDPGIAGPLDGIIAYSGGQQYFVDLMKATGLVNIVFDEDDSLFERADERPGPHDVILAAAEAVRRNRSSLPPPAVQFAYGTADPLAAPALAAVPDVAHRARVLRGPVSVVGLGPHRVRVAALAGGPARPRGVGGAGPRDERGHDARRDRLAVRGGAAHRHGRARARCGSPRPGRPRTAPGRRPTTGAPIVLTADDGSPLRLAPGNTWIELVPNEGSAAFAP